MVQSPGWRPNGEYTYIWQVCTAIDCCHVSICTQSKFGSWANVNIAWLVNDRLRKPNSVHYNVHYYLDFRILLCMPTVY